MNPVAIGALLTQAWVMRLRDVRPDDRADLAAVVAVSSAADAVDAPWHDGLTPGLVRALALMGWDGDPMPFVLAEVAGEVVAVGMLEIPLRDNLSAAWIGGTVHPDHRRRGHGTALFDALEARAGEQGRTVLGTYGWDGTGAQAFALGRGYQLRTVEVCRRVVLTDATRAALAEEYARAAARATAYELVRVAGPLPETLLAATVDAVAAINDAPRDDLAFEDEVFTPDRVRAYERAQAERGSRMYRVLARHRATGQIAGHTIVCVETERPWVAEQHDTTVVRAHRGHRLGLLLKAEMMRWLATEEPAVRRITTENAETNAHMIEVNERLGYQVMGRSLVFQRELG